jgi:signal transduction histidine kinase
MPRATLLRQLRRLGRFSTFRVTVALGLIFVAGVCALLVMIYLLTERTLVARTDEVLGNQARMLLAGPPDGLAARLHAAQQANASGLNHFLLVSPGGAIEAGDIRAPLDFVSPRPRDLPAISGQPPMRVVNLALPDGRRLAVGRDTAQIAELRRDLTAILLTSGAVALLASFSAAIWLSIAPMRRVGRLTALARRIGDGELSLRMPVSPRRDELDVVAETINRMLDEVTRLLEQVKGATDAVAHDLRSPLAHVRQRLADLASHAGDTGEVPPPLIASIEDLDDVLARFNALLRIAELEATDRRSRFEPVDPMTLAAAVCELYGPMAEARQLRLALTGEWGHQLCADPQMLLEALANLVDNAVKFSPPGGLVSVDVGGAGGRVSIAVGDHGPGIPSAERAGVLQRFTRGPQAARTPGSGLGLSLVATIVRIHGFVLDLADNGPGLKASIIA